MSRFFIAWLALGALALVVGVVWLEISEGREQDRRRADDYDEMQEWLRAREVTGRVR